MAGWQVAMGLARVGSESGDGERGGVWQDQAETSSFGLGGLGSEVGRRKRSQKVSAALLFANT